MIEKNNSCLSLKEQFALLRISKSTYHYCQRARDNSNDDLFISKKIDQIYLKYPFFGSRRIAAILGQEEGIKINRKKVQRLMRIMGIEAIYPKPKLSLKNKGHKIYPYLLKNLTINRPNQVWATDITYIPMALGHLYLIAVIDWFSRYVLSWQLSNSLDSGFCIEALELALSNNCNPEIFNSDQGSQFTSKGFTNILINHDIRISMDSKGRWLDNVFIERLWRSLKYEEVYIKSYDSVKQARDNIGSYLTFYNQKRLHQSLNYKTPLQVYLDGLKEPKSVSGP